MKNLFIGIDFSKKTFDVSFFEERKQDEVNYRQFENTKEGYGCLVKWIKQLTKFLPLSYGWIFFYSASKRFSLF
jgi:hypothetical protein